MKNRLIALGGMIMLGVLAFVGVAFGIGGGVDAAGDDAFRINGTTLTSYLGTDAYVSIPDTVTVIGEEAFAGNETLKGVTIPDSVTAISYNAFKDCTALANIILSDRITKVGPGAFEGCTALTTAQIGKNVSSWGTGVFTNCDSLAKVMLDEENSYLTYYNGAIYNGTMTMLYQVLPARKGENYVMPETVEQMDTYAFWNLKNVKNVKLSEKIDSIPKYAMTNMGSVENVSLPNSVRTVQERAFANNEKLAQVAMPATVTQIDKAAFSGSPNVKIFTSKGSAADTFGAERKITVIYSKEYPIDFMDSNEDLEELPDISGDGEDTTTTTITTVTEIESSTSDTPETEGAQTESSFENAQNYIHPLDVPEPDSVIGKTIISTGRAVMLMNNHDGQVYGLPDGVKADVMTESEAAKKEAAESTETQSSTDASNTKSDINISYDESNLDSTENIPQRKYYKQKSLTKYEIGETIKSIGRLAFAESGLKSVTIPESVTKIEYGAFMSCKDLNTVTIADTVTSIGTKAFEGTGWLNAWKSAEPAGDESDFLIVGDGILLAYRGNSAHVQVPEGVKQIGSEVFKGHDEILDADIPATVVRINAEAFRNCGALTGLTGCEGLETVIRGAFYGTQLSETNFTKEQ
ncbi:hypothetical protein C809_01172 [Lachnospiraceae bacterium MD335]|nr:hypothetical protein C809_01172 [Lachnospiraceae bacterium MD335]